MAFFRQILSVEKLNVLHIRCSQSTSLNFSDPALQKYFEKLKLEHAELERKERRTVSESRRLFEMKPIISVLEQRVLIVNNSIDSIKALSNQQSNDKELNKMIKEEASTYLKRIKFVENELQSVLFEPQLSDGGVLLEVTAGAGGQEAMLFARELFNMYESYAKYKDWEVDIASLEKSEVPPGIRKASMLLEGLGVLELMKMEGGIHRAHRIPATEKKGIIHSNTVSVAILPQPAEVEINIPEGDVVIETIHARNDDVDTIDSAVRILHIPTGTIVECREGKSDIKKKDIAMQKLRTLLLKKQQQEELFKNNGERKLQTDFVDKYTKIRTYNYPQGRVIEHREGGTIHNLEGFMEGSEVLENLQDCLLRKQKQRTFMEEINRLTQKNNFILL